LYKAGMMLWKLDLAGVSASISAAWSYRKKSWPHLSGHGTADISVSAVTVVVDIGFSVANGEPTCAVLADNVNIGSFAIHIHGGESWIYNLFIDIFKNKIKEDVAKGIKQGIEKAINNNLNHALQTLPLKQPIQNLLLADYTLVGPPRFASYMVVDLKGEFFDLKHPQEAPFTPSNIPDIQNTNVMLQITISQYVPDTVGFALWKSGVLVINVDDKMIPPDSPIRFNTDSFQSIIPALYNLYPHKDLKATVDPIASPLITFRSNGTIHVGGQFEMIMYVCAGPTNSTHVFTLGINVITEGKIYMKGNNLMINLTYGNVSVSLRQTDIGPFDVTILNNLFLLAIAEGIPFINHKFADGIPLPVIKGVTFVNPYLGFGDGFIYVNTDIQYHPTTSKVIPNSLKNEMIWWTVSCISTQ